MLIFRRLIKTEKKMTIAVVLFWVLATIAVAGVAINRGQSPIVFGALSFFLSPIIALLALIATPVNQDVLERKALRTKSRMQCSQCKELIKPSALVCCHCGHQIRSASRQPSAAA